ncbi:hypothetical protein [Microbacterium sp.]|uniref:hypothetical protein n=1 Tax=Microbacterium sp. TaxID=51671 RepID=UPI0039E46CC9
MSSSWTGAPRGPQRLSKSEIERRLLDTAKEQIQQTGLTVSLEHLRLDELLELADVPKTSFYRVWTSKDRFFARLLEELVQPEGGVGAAYDPETIRVSGLVIRQHPELLATAEGRERLMREMVRVGAHRNFTALLGSVGWRTYMAILATLPGISDEGARERIKTALQRAENEFLDRMADFYRELLPVLHYRLRPGVTTRHLAAAGAAVVEGLVQRNVVSPELVGGMLPGPAIDGGTTDWDLAALGFLGVIQALAEPDPDYDGA